MSLFLQIVSAFPNGYESPPRLKKCFPASQIFRNRFIGSRFCILTSAEPDFIIFSQIFRLIDTEELQYSILFRHFLQNVCCIPSGFSGPAQKFFDAVRFLMLPFPVGLLPLPEQFQISDFQFCFQFAIVQIQCLRADPGFQQLFDCPPQTGETTVFPKEFLIGNIPAVTSLQKIDPPVVEFDLEFFFASLDRADALGYK